MKTALAFLLVATAALGAEPVVLQAGDGTGNFPIYILGEAWRQEDMPKYHAAVDKMLNDFWAVEPYGYLRHIFTIKRYDLVSVENKCSIFEPPAGLTDEELKKTRNRDTALKISYQKPTSDPNLDAAKGVIDGIIGAEKEGIAIVLIQTDIQSAVTTFGPKRCYIGLPANSPVDASGIMAHEMGHGYFGLGDEYCSGRTYNREPPNLSMVVDGNTVKWSHIVRITHPCTPLTGGSAAGTVAWRHGFPACRMNKPEMYGAGFCRVCLEGMTQRASESYTPVADETPKRGWMGVTPFSDLTFSVKLRGPKHEYAKVWVLNGRKLGEGTMSGNTSSISISWYRLFPGYNKVQFMVEDRRNVVSPALAPIGKAPHTVEWYMVSGIPPTPIAPVDKVIDWLE